MYTAISMGDSVCYINAAFASSWIIFLVFTLIYYWLNTRQFKRPEPYVILCVFVFLSLIKYLTTDTNSYEGQFFSQIIQFPELIKQLDSNYTFNYFKYAINTTYHIYLIVFVLGICIMILRRVFLISCFTVYFRSDLSYLPY